MLDSATHVAGGVGEDQKQHLALSPRLVRSSTMISATRSQPRAPNDGLLFPMRKAADPPRDAGDEALRDGTKKISKSDGRDNSRINLTDDADTIAHRRCGRRRPRTGAAAEEGKGSRQRVPEADN